MIKKEGIMTAPQLIEHLENLFKECVEVAKRKNADYSSAHDNAFRNFEAAEYFGIAETKSGILVRATDKFTRICNLLNGKEPAVQNETIMDTIEDFINYLAILHARFEAEKHSVDEQVFTDDSPFP